MNFRPEKVQSKFVNTNISPEARKTFVLETGRWDDDDAGLREILIGLLEDWGAFLELSLYVAALIHFFGGEEKVTRMLPLNRDGRSLGNQRFHLINEDVAFRLTALSGGTDEYESHLIALLRHSPLTAIQWINMARHTIQFVTLKHQT